jgi:hypothetical protein
MQVHRPDFPALIAALEANLPPEPKRAPLVTPPRPPSRSFAQQAKDLAEDDRITHALLAPAVVAQMRQEPYQSPEFAFQYVDRKGRQGAVIPKQEPKADWPFPDPVRPSSTASTEFTNSRDAEPACAGWYEVDGREGEEWAAYYFGIGLGWSNDIEAGASMESKADALEDRFEQIDWRGPRLTGADWPEPPSVAAEEVPSADDCRRAYYHLMHLPKDENGNDASDRLLHEFAGEMNCDSIPANRRAEFIRRCNELR